MNNKSTNFQIHTNSSIILLGLTISLIIIYLFFPIFPGNFYYDIGTILIYSGPIDQIPQNFVLCDGNNNTPDLRGKFIIGAYTEDQVKQVESTNDEDWNKFNNSEHSFIGPGLKVDKVDTTKVDNTIDKAFSRGNVPFIFGVEYIDNYNFHTQDSGTTYFKDYIYKSTTCDDTKVKYYNDSDDSEKVDKCDNDIILTDANMSTRQLKLSKGEDITDEDDFKYYRQINNDESSGTPLGISIQINNSINDNSLEFTHKFVKRRLFRDFEDYTLYLNGQNSRYNILPMNKDYDYTVYDNGNNTTTKIIKDGIQLTKENLHLFSYSIPYTNCPSFFKLAYIIKIK